MEYYTLNNRATVELTNYGKRILGVDETTYSCELRRMMYIFGKYMHTGDGQVFARNKIGIAQFE